MEVETPKTEETFESLLERKTATKNRLVEKAILEACRDVIRESKLKPSPIAHYGLFFQSLVQMMKAKTEIATKVDIQGRIKACLKLMNVCCQFMDGPLTKQIFNETATQLVTLFSYEPPQPIISKGKMIPE